LTRIDILPVKGVKAITYITTCSDKQVVLSVLCSLLNTVGILTPDSHTVVLSLLDTQVQSCIMAGTI
jgi:hypothetical protein